MALNYLESPRELTKIIKEAGEDGVLLVVFDTPRSPSYQKDISALEELEKFSSALKILVLDIDKQEAAVLASQMRLRSIPTMLVIKGGQTVDQIEGALDKEGLERIVSPYLPPKPAAESLKEEFDEALKNGETKRALALIPLLREEKKNDRALWLKHLDLLWRSGRISEMKEVLDSIDEPSLLAEKDNAALLIDTLLNDEHPENEEWEEIRKALLSYAPEEAIEKLLAFVARDRKFGDDLARKVLLGVFSVVGDFGARRRLANLLFV